MARQKNFPRFFNWDRSTNGAVLPVMSCKNAKLAEKVFFDPARNAGDTPVPQEGDFMEAAGTRIAETILRRLGEKPPKGIAVLVGKGHNGGDALIATRKILEAFPKDTVPVKLAFFANSWDDLAPLTMDAYEAFLRKIGKAPTYFVVPESIENFQSFLEQDFGGKFEGIIIDGIYGHGFHPPLPPHVLHALAKVNELAGDILRVAVDLPSGMSDQEYTHYAFKADLTCTLGVAKAPIFNEKNDFFVGSIEMLSIGFPHWESDVYGVDTQKILEKIPLARPRNCDKRTFGHLLIIGGSRSMPGALLLNTLAALRSGSGLISVLCPESVHAAFAARAPGAMWIPCKETPEGSLEPSDVMKNFHALVARADAVLCGSGMGRSPDAQCAIRRIVEETPADVPLVLDADALFPENVFAVRRGGNTVLLPHEGEFARISEGRTPADFCKKFHVSGLILKKVRTEIFCGATHLITSAGSPVLARGGSGDLLAGIVGSLMAQEARFFKNISPNDETTKCGKQSIDALSALLAQAVCWHGAAAKKLEVAQGANCADISALPEFLNAALLG